MDGIKVSLTLILSLIGGFFWSFLTGDQSSTRYEKDLQEKILGHTEDQISWQNTFINYIYVCIQPDVFTYVPSFQILKIILVLSQC